MEPQLEPNARNVTFFTAGISRNMQVNVDRYGASHGRDLTPYGAGGGDLNGTAALIFRGQAGTGADRVSVPRTPNSGGNYTGVV